jgi:3-methyladenine DNA glycosylase/8-oxoguanine DNA glycosylase
MTRSKMTSGKPPADDAAAIAAFIRTRGVTRCPTACAIPTQATIPAADRAALARHGVVRERARQQRMAAAAHAYGNFKVTAPEDGNASEG